MTRQEHLGYWTCFAIIIACSMSPLILPFTAGAIASHYGCRLDEADVYPCIINGQDWGPTLNDYFIKGWYFIITASIGMPVLLILLFYYVFCTRWKS
jgi:hypothetical protein